MVTHYYIRRKSDGAVICSGYCQGPIEKIAVADGCEVVRGRMSHDVARVLEGGEKVMRAESGPLRGMAIAARPERGDK
jgi:hypothetical protein